MIQWNTKGNNLNFADGKTRKNFFNENSFRAIFLLLEDFFYVCNKSSAWLVRRMKSFGRRKTLKFASVSFFSFRMSLHCIRFLCQRNWLPINRFERCLKSKWTSRNCALERQELGHWGGGDSQKVIVMRRMKNKRKNLKHCWENPKLFSLRIVIEWFQKKRINKADRVTYLSKRVM